MSKHELSIVPLKQGAYEKPKRINSNIPAKKYDDIDQACESTVIANDGNVYMPEHNVSKLLNKRKSTTKYVIDNQIKDEHKQTVNNQRLINTSGLVGYLDQNSHQTRDSEEADLNRYGRESLTRIGDSDQAEAVRRKIDTHVRKESVSLRKKRGVMVDEITGESLQAGAAFHHKNSKAVYNNPQDVIDPNKGINVNPETHKEIHRRGIMDEDELECQKEDIKKTVMKNKT